MVLILGSKNPIVIVLSEPVLKNQKIYGSFLAVKKGQTHNPVS